VRSHTNDLARMHAGGRAAADAADDGARSSRARKLTRARLRVRMRKNPE
jgi:hypothetical protein